MTIDLNGNTREAARLVDAALNIIVLGDMFSIDVCQAAASYIEDNVTQANDPEAEQVVARAIVDYLRKKGQANDNV